jgi:hypothetical protein
MPAVEAALPPTLPLTAAVPPLAGVIVVAPVVPVLGFAPVPPLLAVGVVVAAPPDPALAVLPGVPVPLAGVDVPVVGPAPIAFVAVLSPPQANSAAPATMIVDTQSRNGFLTIALRTRQNIFVMQASHGALQ